jgi:hypothetical protein
MELGARDLDEDVLQIVFLEMFRDLVGRPGGEDLPGVEEKHPVANLLDVAHVVGRVEDRGMPLALDVPDQLADLVRDVRVERGGRLVEQEQVRVVEQSLGKVDAGGLARAELTGGFLGQFRNFKKFEQLSHLLFRFRDRVEAGENLQIVPDLQVSGQGGVGGAEIRPLEDFEPVLLEVHPEGPDHPVARGGQA